MAFEDQAPTAYSRKEGDDLTQGGVAWDVTPGGRRVVFPLEFSRGALVIAAKALNGGRAWFTKEPDDRMMASGVILHCEPAGGVAWKAVGPL